MSYLFAAYAIFWALTFLFVFSIASRQKRLEKEVEALRRALARENRRPVEKTDAS